jgi:hypothetical protein
MSTEVTICKECKIVRGIYRKIFGEILCTKCLLIKKGKPEIQKLAKSVLCEKCHNCFKTTRRKDRVCLQCHNKEYFPITYIKEYKIGINETMTCVTCENIFGEGFDMYVHIKGPLCKKCNSISELLFGKEFWSYSVSTPKDQYDLQGHRLCDIIGCNIYGPHLNNDFNGFFCHIHYKLMKDIRSLIRKDGSIKSQLQEYWIEYEARIQEISLRKNYSIEHMVYANKLYSWLLNIQIDITTLESNYINGLFKNLPL